MIITPSLSYTGYLLSNDKYFKNTNEIKIHTKLSFLSLAFSTIIYLILRSVNKCCSNKTNESKCAQFFSKKYYIFISFLQSVYQLFFVFLVFIFKFSVSGFSVVFLSTIIQITGILLNVILYQSSLKYLIKILPDQFYFIGIHIGNILDLSESFIKLFICAIIYFISLKINIDDCKCYQKVIYLISLSTSIFSALVYSVIFCFSINKEPLSRILIRN